MSIDIYGADDNLMDEIEAVARGWSLTVSGALSAGDGFPLCHRPHVGIGQGIDVTYVNQEDAMSVEELRQELGKIHRVDGDDRVQVWITPAARRLVGRCEPDTLVKIYPRRISQGGPRRRAACRTHGDRPSTRTLTSSSSGCGPHRAGRTSSYCRRR